VDVVFLVVLDQQFVASVEPRLASLSMKDPAIANPMNASWVDVQHEPANELFSWHCLGRAAAGAIAERYAYTAYGQPTILSEAAAVLTSSAINNRYTYTAREWDNTIGLHHFRARWMSGLTGRFLTRDPIGYSDGTSLYMQHTMVCR